MQALSLREDDEEDLSNEESDSCNFPRSLIDAIFMPTNPFIIVSIPAVGLMVCQTAWLGGTYCPLPTPGLIHSQLLYNIYDIACKFELLSLARQVP
jgi:hypothetical protein